MLGQDMKGAHPGTEPDSKVVFMAAGCLLRRNRSPPPSACSLPSLGRPPAQLNHARLHQNTVHKSHVLHFGWNGMEHIDYTPRHVLKNMTALLQPGLQNL